MVKEGGHSSSDEHEAASWLFGADVDDYLDLVDSPDDDDPYNHYAPSLPHTHNSYGDTVVPALQHFHHSSLPQNVSFSPIHVGIVPQSTSSDREARVLRYREKKKSRKFQKTIRYASRKAYAETRPRIKGRFAKTTHLQQQPPQHLLLTQSPYAILPSFSINNNDYK